MFENLKVMLNNDFENELLEEAIKNLNSNSRIRFSNFAFVIRELVDILLKNLAEDENIKRCDWYIEPQNTERKIYRNHRIRYIIQGGFSENIFDLMLGVNFNNDICNINNYFRDELSKNVHLTEQCFNYSNEEIEEEEGETFEDAIRDTLRYLESSPCEMLLAKRRWTIFSPIVIV